jgi:hypothetical protein
VSDGPKVEKEEEEEGKGGRKGQGCHVDKKKLLPN